MSASRGHILNLLGRDTSPSAMPGLVQPAVAQLSGGDMWERFEKRVGDSRAGLERFASRQQALQRAKLILSGLPRATGIWRWRVNDQDVADMPVVGEPSDLFEDDNALVTSADAAIAETGSLVFLSHEGQGASPLYLAETLIVLLDRTKMLPSQEALWRLLETSTPERAVNLITGPSRTADIEQTMELGAHGPRTVYILTYPVQ